MSFRFSLEAVLHLYRSLEHQQELRLRTANQHVARGRYEIEQLDLRAEQDRAQQSQQLDAGTTAAELRFELFRASSLSQRRRELDIELKKAVDLRDRQQTAFHEARRRRETLDGLRDRQLHRYQLEASRRAQRQADDLFLMRRNRSNG